MKHKENDILDDFIAESNSKNSRLSVKFFTYNLLALLLMYILMLVMSHSTLYVKLLSNIQMILSVGFLFTSLNGIVFAFQSIRKKEKKAMVHKIANVGNIFFCIIIVGMIFVLIKDISHFF